MSRRRPTRWVAAGGAAAAAVACLLVAAEQDGMVRPAYVAGSWYPGDPTALAKEVDDLLARAPSSSIPDKPIAVISPHAGYRFSGAVAAAGYACLRGHTYERVIVLAFSHRNASRYSGIDVSRDHTAYETPLGNVPVDREACDQLLKNALFVSQPGVDRGEHSLELQLPFLQRVLKDFRLVPLHLGRMSDRDYTEAARAIVPLIDENTLLVASSDFTHFGPNFGYQPMRDNVESTITELANSAAAPLIRGDYDGFVEHLAKTNDTICGRGPISLLLRILSMRGGAKGLRVAYDTSGNITGDFTNSVTYQSFVFTKPTGTLGRQERAQLLHLARRTVTSFLSGGGTPEVEAADLAEALRADGACFVTLENHGQLRGCIGNMVAAGPLYQAVVRNAVSACQDSRFVANPVTAKELDQIDIEISYLTPMKLVADTNSIVVGQHGLMIVKGVRRGVLLPQVAYERGWTRTQFLDQTCRKAGLPPGAWRDPEAEIYSFEAEVFGESE